MIAISTIQKKYNKLFYLSNLFPIKPTTTPNRSIKSNAMTVFSNIPLELLKLAKNHPNI